MYLLKGKKSFLVCFPEPWIRTMINQYMIIWLNLRWESLPIVMSSYIARGSSFFLRDNFAILPSFAILLLPLWKFCLHPPLSFLEDFGLPEYSSYPVIYLLVPSQHTCLFRSNIYLHKYKTKANCCMKYWSGDNPLKETLMAPQMPQHVHWTLYNMSHCQLHMLYTSQQFVNFLLTQCTCRLHV